MACNLPENWRRDALALCGLGELKTFRVGLFIQGPKHLQQGKAATRDLRGPWGPAFAELRTPKNAMPLRTRVEFRFELWWGRHLDGPPTLRVPRLLRLLLLHGRHALLVPPRQVRRDS